MEKTMNVKERAMLITLSISVWTARSYDRKISEKVAKEHNTATDVGRYNKKLLNKAKSYEAIVQHAGDTRKWHYANTLPWSDTGSRILTSKNFLPYSEEYRHRKEKFDDLLSAFVSEYPKLKEDSKALLNGLYMESDYPMGHEIGERFSIGMSILPLPSGEDFRVDLGDAEVAIIRRRIEEQTQAAQVVAMRDLWSRLHEGVSKLVQRLGDPEAVFRDTLITNLRDLCSLLPRLNLTNDPELENTRLAVEGRLASYDPQLLRDDAGVRATVAAEAAKIQQVMAAYMGG